MFVINMFLVINLLKSSKSASKVALDESVDVFGTPFSVYFTGQLVDAILSIANSWYSKSIPIFCIST